MLKMTSTQNELMSNSAKAVVHLRAQQARKRLGLIFGSGASNELGFPQWQQLVERIAADPEVEATALADRFRLTDLTIAKSALASKTLPSTSLARSLASITQLLFSHFRERCVCSDGLTGSLTFLQEQRIRTRWMQIIHSSFIGTSIMLIVLN